MPTLEKHNKLNLKSILLVVYLTSFMLVEYSLYIGFSFKPYMMVSLIIILIALSKNKTKTISVYKKMPIYEVFIVFFVMYATIRNIFAGDILLGFKGSVALWLSLFVYYFTAYSFKRINNDTIFRFIYWSGIINLLIIAIGFVFKDNRIFELDRTVNRLKGYVQDPNFFAVYLSLPLIIVMFYFIKGKKNKIMAFLFLGVLFLTYSRATYISIILTIVYLLYLLRNEIPRFRTKIVITIAMIVVGLLILSSLPFTKPIVDVAMENITARFNETASKNARELLIQIGIDTFKENPLFGVGMLNVRYYTLDFITNNYLHNTYLEVFVEQGIIGGFLYLGFVISFIMQKCNNVYSKILKAVVICQLMMIFFLTAVNNEALFLSIGLFRAINSKQNPDVQER